MKDSLFHRWGLRLLAVLFTLFVMTNLSLTAFGDDDDDDDDDESRVVAEEVYTEETWENEEKPRIQGILLKKTQEINSKIESEVTMERVVEFIRRAVRARKKDILGDFSKLRLPSIEIDWSDYQKRPTKSKETIVDEVERQARAEAQEVVNPDERRDQVDAEAEELYRMYRIGDRVSLVLRDGRGPNAFVDEGLFTGINEEYVLVGNRMIPSRDLDPVDRAKFYENLNAEAKEEYIRLQKGKIQVEYDSYVQDLVIRRTPEALLENGYVPNIWEPMAHLKTSKINLWMSKYELVTRFRKAYIEWLQEEFGLPQINNYMRSQGFIAVPVLDKEGKETWTQNKYGKKYLVIEWISQKEKDRRDGKLNNPNQGGDPMMGGMPPGGMPPGGMPPPGMR